MVASSSVPTPTPAIDWADDTDEEIDFGAPVFSDDEDLPASMTTGLGITPDPSSDNSRGPSGTTSTTGSQTYPRNRTLTSDSVAPRYTAGFADGSDRSLDRRTHNDSSLQPMSSRVRSRGDHSSPYRDAPNSRSDRTPSSSGYHSTGRGAGGSYDRDSHRKAEGRRDTGSGSGHGQRSTRQVIPLPPKPVAALDANHHPRLDRSRSPSYRSQSPLPGPERRWDSTGQHPSSPYAGNHQSLSPNPTQPPAGLSTRSMSPNRPSRAHMDEVSQPRDHSARRSRESASSGDRWEKIAHEDKPYPMLPPAAASGSPKDDVIYFRRREGRTNDQSHQERTASGTMYHERIEANDPRYRNSERSDGPGDRWEKNSVAEPDRPYPERSQPPPAVSNTHGKHSRTRSRGQADIRIAIATPSPPQDKPSQRGNRGKGKDQQKRRSKEQPLSTADGPEEQDKEEHPTVPWWEQSTYLKSKKEEPKPEQPLPEPSKGSKQETQTTPKRSTKDLSAAEESSKVETETNGQVPWWEQSTYKVKPKTNDPVADVGVQLASTKLDSATASSSSTLLEGGKARDSKVDAETMARRRALGQKAPVSGVEALTLVSRGGDDSGSNHSLKTRSVQERVFSEIKSMIGRYEQRYGQNKLCPIPPRTQQSEAMDKILESFRKLREGLFATETRDAFAVEVYEQSILSSLYAGNIPELTKALHQLVHELHPAVHKSKPGSTPSILVDISMSRQKFLGLYILYQLAAPNGQSSSSPGTGHDSLSKAIARSRTETDRLVATLLCAYERHLRLRSAPEFGSDLLFALAYWKSIRDGNWVKRERLLSRTPQEDAVPWEQRLMIQHSMADSLGFARRVTVSVICKAYYSLRISDVAQAVGLTARQADNSDEEWLKKLHSSYGLMPSIVVRDGHLMFKAKS